MPAAWGTAVPLLLTGALVATPVLAADAAWRVVGGEVRVSCPMTVGGSFEARTSVVEGTVTLAGAAVVFGGDISVDLRTLETGIGLRNEHMQAKYLEVGRGPGFDRAVLSDIRLGAGDPRAVQGRAAFSGILLLHGTKRPVSGQATVRAEQGSVQVEAHFPVRIADFGIAKPQYLGVGVRDPVTVTVSLVAEPTGGQEASR